ncbi:MAG: hypothetical protein Q9204_008351 [Flavoplaca sp. TL-2023a]
MAEYRDPQDMSEGELMQIYHAGSATTTPEFSNIDPEEKVGFWRIPAVNMGVRTTPAGMALLLSIIDFKVCGRVWRYLAEGVGPDRGDIYLSGRLSQPEMDAFLGRAIKFPDTLWLLGIPAPIMGLPQRRIMTPDDMLRRPMVDSIRADSYAMPTSLGGLPPPPGRSGRRGINGPPDGGMTRYMDQSMGRDMDLGFPATHRRLAHRQPMSVTANIIVSSPSEDTTDSDASESESDTQKRGTKKKNPKSKPQGKSQSKGQKKAQRRKQSSTESSESESESEDEPRRKPKKTVKKAKPKPIEGRRRRSPSDDKAAYSADERRKKGKAKTPVRNNKPEGKDREPSRRKALEAPERPGRRTRGRSPSDDEGQTPSKGNKGDPSEGRSRAEGPGKKVSELKDQGASSGKAGKAQEGPSEGKHRGRIPPESVGPPRLDPAEQAKLDALKAQNGYGVERLEKSG